jgi:hypothetical protein
MAEVECHHFAPQQVLDLNASELVGTLAPVQQLLQRGENLELDADSSAPIHDPAHYLLRGRRDRDHQQLDAVALDDLLQIVRGAEH